MPDIPIQTPRPRRARNPFIEEPNFERALAASPDNPLADLPTIRPRTERERRGFVRPDLGPLSVGGDILDIAGAPFEAAAELAAPFVLNFRDRVIAGEEIPREGFERLIPEIDPETGRRRSLFERLVETGRQRPILDQITTGLVGDAGIGATARTARTVVRGARALPGRIPRVSATSAPQGPRQTIIRQGGKYFVADADEAPISEGFDTLQDAMAEGRRLRGVEEAPQVVQRELPELAAEQAVARETVSTASLDDLVTGRVVERAAEASQAARQAVRRATSSTLDERRGPLAAKMQKIFDDAKPVRRLNIEEIRQERGFRFGQSREVSQALGGEEGARAGLRALRGEIQRTPLEPIRPQFTSDEVRDLFDLIIKEPGLGDGEKATGWQVLLELLDNGKVPTQREAAILELAFGNDLMTQVRRLETGAEREVILSAINLPRAIRSAWDLSGVLRQGLFLSAGHPIEGIKALRPMLRAAVSPRYSSELQEGIRANKYYRQAVRSGVFFADPDGPLLAREEAFMSDWGKNLRKWTGVNISERAFNGYLNKLRMDVYAKIAGEWDAAGIRMGANQKRYENLASFINLSTGRGSLGNFNASAPYLNAIFFSPRWFLSRIQLPMLMLSADNAVRRQLVRSSLGFFGTGITVLSLLKMSGLADVETNPTSADFGQIRIGPARIDFWGGFRPTAIYIARMVANIPTGGRALQALSAVRSPVAAGVRTSIPSITEDPPSIQERTGGTKSTFLGRSLPRGLGSTTLNFLRSKLAPIPGFAVDAITGRTFTGEEVDATTPGGLLDIFMNNMAPMIANDFWDAISEMGLLGPGLAAPAFFGAGFSAYSSVMDVKQAVSRELHNKEWIALNSEERDAVDADQRVVQKEKEAEEAVREPNLTEKVSAAFIGLDNAQTHAERKLLDDLQNPEASGRSKREGIQQYKRRLRDAYEIAYSQEIEKWLDGDSAVSIRDTLREMYWSVPLEIVDGEPDYLGQNAVRQGIIGRIDILFPDEKQHEDVINHIHSKADPKKRFNDMAIAPDILQYEADQELLRPYWALGRGLSDRQKSSLRSQLQAADPNILNALLRWDYKVLPGQRKASELQRRIRELSTVEEQFDFLTQGVSPEDTISRDEAQELFDLLTR